MNLFLTKLFALAVMLLGLPAIGIVLAGHSLWRYLEFPPRTQFLVHAPFSPLVFTVLLVAILLAVLPLGLVCALAIMKATPEPAKSRFPYWGWAGCLASGCFWLIAWTRFSWAEPIQEHTFFPLWISYTVVVNALTFRRTGSCMITQRPLYFCSLYPLSALFWWFFEYLNRFVQNWSYTASHYSPLTYFVLATLAFSTVLPAVLGTREYLQSFPWLKSELSLNIPWSFHRPRLIAVAALLVSALALGMIGIVPDLLFPLLWVAPLVILIAVRTLAGEPHLLQIHSTRNQKAIVASMLAALICGFFWEMWNSLSLVKWTYAIPFVDRFTVFEMPILGYAGYLPFGLECTVVGELVAATKLSRSGVGGNE